jgi:hypothetical protein
MDLYRSKRITLSLALAGLLITVSLAAAAPTARTDPGIPFAPAPAIGATYRVVGQAETGVRRSPVVNLRPIMSCESV